MADKFSNYTLGGYQPKQFSYKGNSYKWENLTASEIAMLAEDPNFNPISKKSKASDPAKPEKEDSKESEKEDSKESTK